ncbi:MAG TPA: MBL fold metallo-hydrolase [Nitrososphaeraceae archaeon]|nr:MBL fold metallo-hydrolase [Nitrososphaeraceae archaeon]
MQANISYSKCGIVIYDRSNKILLDPSRHDHCDFTFISHAHSDHLAEKSDKKRCRSTLLMSKATCLIARSRGYKIDNFVEEHDGFELIDNGHILGSKGLLIDDCIYYTGDISIRERGFMKPAKLPAVDTLLIESTFGKPEYIFPSITEVLHKTNNIISESYDRGVPVILMGYSLGKAQLLTELFANWGPVYLHESIQKMNSIYRELGIPLIETLSHADALSQGLLSKDKPWIMIAPLTRSGSNFVKYMKSTYGAITVGFSGWAVDNKYKFIMGLDYALPLSDHCDFHELIRVVERCKPKKIYTYHGFAAEFSSSLRKMGFDAEPLCGTNTRKTKPMRNIKNIKNTMQVTNHCLDIYM